MTNSFNHVDLNLITPPFDSEVTDLIIDLEKLRDKIPGGTTPSHTFFQIKHIFHMLESIGSARIEGNRTTILEYIETKIEKTTGHSESIKEIENMEKALKFIDEQVNDFPPINRAFLSEIHKIVVKDLTEEGSKTPGEYRKGGVKIRGSKHVVPQGIQVQSYMDDLIDFINKKDLNKYDLLKTAIAHHRFVWIHPFDNGNGRTVRLLTYAMLVKLGFNVHLARILNPTAVFCHDRERYYASLSEADQGRDKGLMNWCIYMLSGLKREIERVDKLSDYKYLKSEILIPTINFSIERKLITDVESKILRIAIDKREFRNADVQKVFPNRNRSDISRLIRKLRKKKMISPIKKNQRKYVLSFNNNYLLRGIITSLDKVGFLPVND